AAASAGQAGQREPSPAQVQRFGARAAPGPSDAAATAFLVARAWLGDVGSELPLGLDGPPTGAYVEHLAVESVDHPGPGAAVVTLVAVLLDVEDGRYGAARVVRLAVPVRLDSAGARPAGNPWWLLPPSLEADPPRWTPVDEPDRMADAGVALAGAGYTVTQVAALEASPGWPLRATVHATAPGEDQPRQHTVWLREHLGELVVAGWLPAASPPPTGDPTSATSPQEPPREP
ncbi:MAG TPA: hypothetical protein VHF25_10290, partial [Nitriliruptorales bacterium]|nr:hypothetical protein [Nitriliruptorales bacterium]